MSLPAPSNMQLLTCNMAKRAEKETFHQAPPFKGSYIQKQIT